MPKFNQPKVNQPKVNKSKLDDRPDQSKSLPSQSELPPVQLDETIVAGRRPKPLNDIQRLLAEDSVHAFLYQNQWVTVANKNIRGLWKDMPIFVNDLSALSWA